MWVITTADITDPEEFIRNKDTNDSIKLFLKKCIERQLRIDSAESEDEEAFYSQSKIFLCKIGDVVSCDDVHELIENYTQDVAKAKESAVEKIFKKHGKDIVEQPKIWLIQPKEATKQVS